ncbi:motile sperm domain-containing protein 2-like [Panonychus citri]|uniref:motile sperm domain-containing protein 2-like n=1 Tax=Panonychus citri TaxID=50023 RepID=UPI0023074820|nr:motile sperm domain-containing protein 2-like [Panonychus citri]
MSNNKERTNRSGEAVKQIRQSIEDDYRKDPDLFDETDYKRVLNDDWFVKRFLLISKRKVDLGYKALRAALCWRKEMNLRSMKDYNFPVEIFTSSLLFPYECDREGHPVVYLRVSKYRKIPEMENILRQYVIHLLDKMDSFTNGNGIGMIFDLTGASTSSIDWTFLKYFTDTGTNYFPYSIKYVLIYNLPWYLNAIQKVALSLVPKENMGIIKFGKGPQIFDYVDENNLPDFLGGSCTRDYRYSPKGAPKLEEMLLKADELNNQQIDKIVSIFTEMSIPDKETEGKTYINPTNMYDEKANDNLIKTTAIEVTQEAPEMNQTYLIIEPNQLIFSDNLDNEHLSSQLLIHNICDKVIAFKIKSNNSLKYRVTPAIGLILPKSTFKVNLVRLIGLEGIVRNNKIDKILIESQPVTVKSMTGSEFYNLWCNQDEENKQLIKSHCITCKINKSSTGEKKKVHRVHFKAREDEQDSKKQQQLHIHQRMAVLQKKYISFESQHNKTSLIFSITITFFIIIMSYFLATHSDLKTVRYLRNNATLISSDQ